jgi:hypothetical protein
MPASIMCRDQNLPAHLVSQLKELLFLEAGPLPLALLAQRYEEEYSYPLEYQSLGFTCQEDLFSSPSAAAVFSLQLDGLGWSLRLLQEQEPGDYSSFRKKVEVPPEVEVRLSQLLAPGPSLQLSPTPARSAPTLQVEAMPLLYTWGSLRPQNYGCSTLLELCLALPHICSVYRRGGQHWVCHPRYLHLVVKREEGQQNSGHSGLISSNTMVDVGKEHAEEQQQELVVKESSVCLVKQLPCDEYSTAEPTEPSESDQILTLRCDVEEKVKKTLRTNLVIRKSEFETKYEKAVGDKLPVKRLGFFNTNAFLRSISGRIIDLTLQDGDKEIMVRLHQS